jgi:hypothetical protein
MRLRKRIETGIHIWGYGQDFRQDPFRIGLAQTRPFRFAECVFFIAPLLRASSHRFEIKKPTRLCLVGFVTPSGFKPETF